MGDLNGQLNISKVTENNVSNILSVELKEPIMAVHSSLGADSGLITTVLMENTVIRYAMQSDHGISGSNNSRDTFSVRGIFWDIQYECFQLCYVL